MELPASGSDGWERAAIEEQLRGYFSSQPGGEVVAVYLFGSVARERARAGSDVDVAVLYGKAPPASFGGLPLRVADELEVRLGRPVDVVTLNRAPVDLVHRVLRDGRLVLERDRSARIRFEVRARNEFFDLQPFLLRYRRMDR